MSASRPVLARQTTLSRANSVSGLIRVEHELYPDLGGCFERHAGRTNGGAAVRSYFRAKHIKHEFGGSVDSFCVHMKGGCHIHMALELRRGAEPSVKRPLDVCNPLQALAFIVVRWHTI